MKSIAAIALALFVVASSHAGIIYQQAADPGGWVPSMQSITTCGGHNSITVPAPTGSRFFRLAKP